MRYLAVDIGGTKILGGVPDPDGGWEVVLRRPTPEHEPFAQLIAMLDRLAAGRPVDGIAVSMPGPFERRTGRLLTPPNLSTGWRGVALVDELEARYGCPVLAENDSNCAALAEALFGAGAGHRTVVYYSISTGVGTGVVHDGQVVTGRRDTEGGHHVVWPAALGGPRCACGSVGCLEAVVSGVAVRRRYGVPPEQLSAQAWAEVGRWLGVAVVNAAMFHDPDVVVFGGGMSAAWDQWSPALRATVEETLTLREPPLVLPAALGDERNLYGALACLLPEIRFAKEIRSHTRGWDAHFADIDSTLAVMLDPHARN